MHRGLPLVSEVVNKSGDGMMHQLPPWKIVAADRLNPRRQTARPIRPWRGYDTLFHRVLPAILFILGDCTALVGGWFRGIKISRSWTMVPLSSRAIQEAPRSGFQHDDGGIASV